MYITIQFVIFLPLQSWSLKFVTEINHTMSCYTKRRGTELSDIFSSIVMKLLQERLEENSSLYHIYVITTMPKDFSPRKNSNKLHKFK